MFLCCGNNQKLRCFYFTSFPQRVYIAFTRLLTLTWYLIKAMHICPKLLLRHFYTVIFQTMYLDNWRNVLYFLAQHSLVLSSSSSTLLPWGTPSVERSCWIVQLNRADSDQQMTEQVPSRFSPNCFPPLGQRISIVRWNRSQPRMRASCSQSCCSRSKSHRQVSHHFILSPAKLALGGLGVLDLGFQYEWSLIVFQPEAQPGCLLV